MIRLSEAMARMHCSEEVRSHDMQCQGSCECHKSPDLPSLQVQPKHVKEAFRLLNKSIIRVETPDIDFEEGEKELMNGKDMTVWVCVYVEGGDNIESYVAFCSWIPNSISFHLVWHYAGDAEPVVNGVGGEGQEEEEEREEQPDKLVKPEKPAKKIRVTYEEYRTIANLLILHLRQVEETSEEGVFFTNTCDDLAG